MLQGLNERINIKNLQKDLHIVTLQKKLPLLLCNNIHEMLTILQPWVRIWGTVQSSIDLVSTFRRLNVYQIIPELNVKWHLRSVLKDGCTRLWFESPGEQISPS